MLPAHKHLQKHYFTIFNVEEIEISNINDRIYAAHVVKCYNLKKIL